MAWAAADCFFLLADAFLVGICGVLLIEFY
jgi:hypothetical protein